MDTRWQDRVSALVERLRDWLETSLQTQRVQIQQIRKWLAAAAPKQRIHKWMRASTKHKRIRKWLSRGVDGAVVSHNVTVGLVKAIASNNTTVAIVNAATSYNLSGTNETSISSAVNETIAEQPPLAIALAAGNSSVGNTTAIDVLSTASADLVNGSLPTTLSGICSLDAICGIDVASLPQLFVLVALACVLAPRVALQLRGTVNACCRLEARLLASPSATAPTSPCRQRRSRRRGTCLRMSVAAVSMASTVGMAAGLFAVVEEAAVIALFLLAACRCGSLGTDPQFAVGPTCAPSQCAVAGGPVGEKLSWPAEVLWQMSSTVCAWVFPLWLLPAVRPADTARVLTAALGESACNVVPAAMSALERLSGVWLVLLSAALMAIREMPASYRKARLRILAWRHIALALCGLLAARGALLPLAALLATALGPPWPALVATPSASASSSSTGSSGGGGSFTTTQRSRSGRRRVACRVVEASFLTVCAWGCAACGLVLALMEEDPQRWEHVSNTCGTPGVVSAKAAVVAMFGIAREFALVSSCAIWRATCAMLVAEALAPFTLRLVWHLLPVLSHPAPGALPSLSRRPSGDNVQPAAQTV